MLPSFSFPYANSVCIHNWKLSNAQNWSNPIHRASRAHFIQHSEFACDRKKWGRVEWVGNNSNLIYLFLDIQWSDYHICLGMDAFCRSYASDFRHNAWFLNFNTFGQFISLKSSDSTFQNKSLEIWQLFPAYLQKV